MNDLHFAVVVGINPYPAIGPLTAAHADAEEFYDWVTSRKGGKVPGANAIRILGEAPPGGEASPTREFIYDRIEEFRQRVKDSVDRDPDAWPTTRFYFFAAGHGIASERDDAALLAANVTRDRYTRHVSCKSVLEFFERVQCFRELVLFADCCRTSLVGTVKRIPADMSGDDGDWGAVRQFMAFGAIFGRQAKEEIDYPADKRRGYFSRALLDGLRTGHIGRPRKPITSDWLKEFIPEHMRRASEGKFKGVPLQPDFQDIGQPAVVFGTPSSPPQNHPVRIQVDDRLVTGLEIRAEGMAPLVTTQVAANPAVFECQLPIGLYEAVPGGVPRPASGQEWLFRVIEGGVKRAFTRRA
jgi:hypothetical protein